MRTMATLLCLLAAVTAEPRELRGKRIVLEPRFPSQRTDMPVFRPTDGVVRLAGVDHVLKAVKRPRRIRLGKVPVSVRRNGERVEYAVLDGREFTIDRTPLRLVDANGNGTFELEGDGYQLPPSVFVLPLRADRPVLIVGRNRLCA